MQDDLWASFSEVISLGSSPLRGMSLKEIMDTWTLQPGYPVVHVARPDNDTALLTQVTIVYFKYIIIFISLNFMSLKIQIYYSFQESEYGGNLDFVFFHLFIDSYDICTVYVYLKKKCTCSYDFIGVCLMF